MKIRLDNFRDILTGNYILLVTSNSVEKDAVNKVLAPKTKIDLDLNDKGCYIGLVENNIVVHLSGTSGVTSHDSIGRLVIEFISRSEFPKPKVVLMVGFCWGNPENTKSGQTIIANTVYSLNSTVVKEGKQQFKSLIFQSKFQRDFLESDCLNGAIASLETLIADVNFRDDIIEQYPTIFGGEMEGFSYIPTLISNEIDWLIVKTVSDFGGDDYTREIQKEAALKSAIILPKLIKEIEHELDDYNSSKSLDHLKNILRGDVISISRNEFSSESLNDFLNDIIGPVIESKLQEYFYAIDETGDSTFVRCFCDLILEICQNSFRHGNSTEFKISFHSKTIILNDDGIDFDISGIEGTRGGAKAWKNVHDIFIQKEFVRYSHSKANVHKFHLEKVKDFLTNLRENCSVRIIPGTIGNIYSRNQILDFNENCTSVYLKDNNNRMTSRRLSLVEEVRRILEKGIVVYLSVHNEYEAKEYQNSLVDFGDRLIIIYE